MKARAIIIAAAFGLTAAAGHAATWTLDPQASRLSFVSIKAGDVGEANRFTALRGEVGEDGSAIVEIRLDSVDTGVEIRDERMREHLFDTENHPLASVRLQADMAAFEKLKVGESLTRETEATILIAGETTIITAPLVVTRIDKNRVLVEPETQIVLDAGAFGLEDGVAKLKELAGLDQISLAVPTSFSFYFDRS